MGYAAAVISAASLLTACATKNTVTGIKNDGQKHFSVFISGTSEEASDNNKIFKKIKDELGYTFDCEYLVGNNDEKVGVMIAGGDYPDIVSCSDNKFVQAGALVPLDDYISEEKTPNLYKHIGDRWNEFSYQEDGHLYVIPNYGIYNGEQDDGFYQGAAFWMQKAVLEDAGYPEVKTLDQYFKIIEDYKAKYPVINGVSTIGFEILAVNGFEWVLTTAPNYLQGNSNNGSVEVNPETYEAKIYANSDYAKSYFKKLNEEYAKGIVDPEAFTQNKDQYNSKIASGGVLGMFDQRWVFIGAEKSLMSQQMYEREYVPLPITFDESIEPHYRDRPVANIGQGYGISVNCQNPEAVVQMFETFLSDEWQKIFQWGIEGEDYHTDKNGRLYRTPEQRLQQTDVIWKSENKANGFFHNLPKIQGYYEDGNGASPDAQQEEFEASLSEYDRKFLKRYNKKNWYDFLNTPTENPEYYPAWNIDLVDGSPAHYAEQKMKDLAKKYLPQLVMTEESSFDLLWDEYCAAFDDIDVEAYEKRINEHIQWRLEHWK